MPVTGLIVGGLGAAGAIGGAAIQSNAAKNASNQQVAMQEQALSTQKQMYNQGADLQKQYFGTAQGTLQPFISAGQSVLPTLQSLITPGASQTATLEQTPGFQFASQYGTKAATNALSSKGLGASAGPLATAISGYNQGLASTTWQNVVNALQSYATLGGNAAGTLAGIAGNTGNTALSAAVGAGNSQAGTLTGIGQSQAAGTLGSANAVAGGFQGTTNALSSAALLGSLGSGGGLYGNIGKMPATGPGAPSDLQSNLYAISQGINPYA